MEIQVLRQQLVTVEDNSNPVAVTQDITVELDGTNGQATITASDVDDGSSDNCSLPVYTLDVTNFDCSDIGDNTVTLTVTILVEIPVLQQQL